MRPRRRSSRGRPEPELPSSRVCRPLLCGLALGLPRAPSQPCASASSWGAVASLGGVGLGRFAPSQFAGRTGAHFSASLGPCAAVRRQAAPAATASSPERGPWNKSGAILTWGFIFFGHGPCAPPEGCGSPPHRHTPARVLFPNEAISCHYE